MKQTIAQQEENRANQKNVLDIVPKLKGDPRRQAFVKKVFAIMLT